MTWLCNISRRMGRLVRRFGNRCHRASENYYQLPWQSVQGRPLEEIAPAHLRPRVKAAFDRALKGEHISIPRSV